MKRLLTPDFIAPSIADVTADTLLEYKIKALSLDVDGTIMSHHGQEIDPVILRQLHHLGESGVRIALSSNAYGPRVDQLEAVAATIDPTTEVITPASLNPEGAFEGRYKKPHPAMILEVARRNHIDAQEVLHAGDQIFKDVLAANRAGAWSMLVPKYGIGGDWRVERLQRPLEKAIIPLLGLGAQALRMTPAEERLTTTAQKF